MIQCSGSGLRELAAARPRFGYRRLWVMLRREGWQVNHKRIYRLYRQEELSIRVKRRRKRASHTRVSLPAASAPNERWSMDFITDRLDSGRYFRVLTVVDHFSRECPVLEAGVSMTGQRVAQVLERLSLQRPLPRIITVDNGSEFYSQAMDSWAYRHGVQLEFIRPGKPVENAMDRELQRQASRRMPERASVPVDRRCASEAQGLEDRLQRPTTPQLPGRPNSYGVRQGLAAEGRGSAECPPLTGSETGGRSGLNIFS